MNLNCIIFCLSLFFSQLTLLQGFKELFSKNNFIKNKKSNSIDSKKIEMVKIQEQRFQYCEDWSCGEVQWDFLKENESESENENENVYTIVIPSKKYLICDEQDKFEFPENKKCMVFTSGIIKVLYKDIVNPDTFITEFQNIYYKNYITLSSTTTDIFMFTIIGFLSYGYKTTKKNEINFIKNQRKSFGKTTITLEEIKNYLKLQKYIKTFVITLLFIFTKNVKIAE
jgi:hypothetical protein